MSAPTSSTESTESQDLVGADQSNQVGSTTNRDLIREDLEIIDTAKTRIKTRTRTGSRMEEFFKVSKSELVKEEAKNPSPSAPPTATMVVVGKRRGKRRPNLSAGQLKVDALMKEMNDYVKQFIVDNYENVLGPSVFMMMCSTLPYPVMTSQIEDIMRTAPLSFKNNVLVKEFLDKAKENMQLLEEHKRMQQNVQASVQD